MPMSREGFRKYTTDERINMVLRAAMQASCRAFKQETIDKIFETEKSELGKSCAKWAWRIVGSLKHNKELMEDLLLTLWFMYKKGINPDVDDSWHLIWIMDGMPSFSSKLESFPATGRVAAMDDLDRMAKKEEEEIEEWWIPQ